VVIPAAAIALSMWVKVSATVVTPRMGLMVDSASFTCEKNRKEMK
jgi:hypothetical protein